MLKTDLNWVAGIFEGEGSCGCYKQSKGNTIISSSISNNDLTLLNEVRRIIKRGYLQRHTPKNIKDKNINYRYRADSATGRWFLNLILPYIRSKYKKTQIIKTLKKDKANVKPRKIYKPKR